MSTDQAITDTERGSVSRPALGRLIATTADDFARTYWGEKPLLSQPFDEASAFDDLFSLAAADELVSNRGIRTPFARMANEGTLLDPSRYTSSGGFGAEVGDQLDSAKVLAEFTAGATLVLQGLHRTWAPLSEFTRLLASELAAPTQVNAYVTPASSRGFDPHYDVHDVFVIQIHGEKHWKIHPPVHESPLRGQPWTDHRDAVSARAEEEPVIDATFRPGDVLYLPRGWIHSATALGGTSIHLTIGVSALTRWDVLQRLVAQAANEPALRAAMPLGVDFSDSAALDSIIGATVSSFANSLEHTDSAVVAQSLTQQLVAATRPESIAALATVEALATLDDSTVVGWRAGLQYSLERSPQNLRIVLAGKTVTLPAEATTAVETLAGGADCGAASLADLDESSSVVVARRLLREGVLVLR